MTSLSHLLAEHARIEQELSDGTAHTREELRTLLARHAELQPLVTLHQEREHVLRTLEEQELLVGGADADLALLAAEELPTLQEKKDALDTQIRHALLPKPAYGEKDIILEIRAGAGGDEASLFARDLYTMYVRFAEAQGWNVILVSTSRSDVGGYKEIIAEIHGTNVYGTLRFESGVHRIQRIPETEKMGRVHTSTATVAMLPAADEVDMTLRPEDLRIDTFRAGGHGGQGVQKTESAVRILHIPTGLIVQCQDERSQQKNRERALGVLRSRLLARHTEEQMLSQRSARRAQIGTGDRSEKIRTYNVPQNRVTDHRIKQSWHGIPDILAGHLDLILSALRTEEEEELLKNTDA